MIKRIKWNIGFLILTGWRRCGLRSLSIIDISCSRVELIQYSRYYGQQVSLTRTVRAKSTKKVRLSTEQVSEKSGGDQSIGIDWLTDWLVQLGGSQPDWTVKWQWDSESNSIVRWSPPPGDTYSASHLSLSRLKSPPNNPSFTATPSR